MAWHANDLVARTSETSPVCLVFLVHLVHRVYLVGLVQPNKQDKPNKPNEQGRLVDFLSILLGTDGGLNKLGPSAEIGRAPDLVGVVVVGALDNIEEFGWLGCLEDLPA